MQSILSHSPLGHELLSHHQYFWTRGCRAVVGHRAVEILFLFTHFSFVLLHPQDGLFVTRASIELLILLKHCLFVTSLFMTRRKGRSTMPRKERSKVLWKDMFTLRSCVLVFIRAEGLACCRTHSLSGLRSSLRIPLLSEHTLTCSGQRLAGAHL